MSDADMKFWRVIVALIAVNVGLIAGAVCGSRLDLSGLSAMPPAIIWWAL